MDKKRAYGFLLIPSFLLRYSSFSKGRIFATFFLIIFVLVASRIVYADTLTFDATYRGWVDNLEIRNDVLIDSNYYAGLAADIETGELVETRNFFRFDPVFSGTITSAKLLLNTADYLSPDASETYEVSSLSSPFEFDDVAAGTYYGEGVFTSSDDQLDVEINLNAAAISNIISGESFWIGGKVTTLDFERGDFYDALFAWSWNHAVHPTRLAIVYEPSAPVPEPTTMLLFGTGIAGLAGIRLRRRKAA